MSSEPNGDTVFDTSALIELLDLTPKGNSLRRALISNRLTGYLSEISLSETIYILCRKFGYENAISRVRSLIDSGYFVVERTSEIVELAGRYKCERALSIADCYSLAAGKHLGLPVLFARREVELEKEIKRKAFDVRILFLED